MEWNRGIDEYTNHWIEMKEMNWGMGEMGREDEEEVEVRERECVCASECQCGD